jgi:hypothetical protein
MMPFLLHFSDYILSIDFTGRETSEGDEANNGSGPDL